MSKKTAEKSDYLAIAYLLGGSSFGRSASMSDSISHCIDSLKDWSHLIDFRDVSVIIHIHALHDNSEPADEVSWDDTGMFYKNSEDEYIAVDESCYMGRIDVQTSKHRTRVKSSSKKFWTTVKDDAKGLIPEKRSNT